MTATHERVDEVARFVRVAGALLATSGPLSPQTVRALVLAHCLTQECALFAPTKETLRASAVGSLGLAFDHHEPTLAMLFGIRAAAKSMGGPLS